MASSRFYILKLCQKKMGGEKQMDSLPEGQIQYSRDWLDLNNQLHRASDLVDATIS